jgi:hypothetical protein
MISLILSIGSNQLSGIKELCYNRGMNEALGGIAVIMIVIIIAITAIGKWIAGVL